MSRLKDVLRELLDEEEQEEVISDTGEETTDPNRMLEQDRSPAHSDTPQGMLVTEYGINAKIKAHANRQRFGALSKVRARTK